jgi:hypothetical protein
MSASKAAARPVLVYRFGPYELVLPAVSIRLARETGAEAFAIAHRFGGARERWSHGASCSAYCGAKTFSLISTRASTSLRPSYVRCSTTHSTISQIGKDLAVDYVLEGSVRRERNKLRVTAQLVQVSDQTHVWAQDYDRKVLSPNAFWIAVESVMPHLVLCALLFFTPSLTLRPTDTARIGSGTVRPGVRAAALPGCRPSENMRRRAEADGMVRRNNRRT